MYFTDSWEKFRKLIDKGLKTAALFIILFYRGVVRGLLGGGGGCRFYPSCGDYALQAYRQDSFFKASRKVLYRLLNCHPFGLLKWPSGERTLVKRKREAK